MIQIPSRCRIRRYKLSCVNYINYHLLSIDEVVKLSESVPKQISDLSKNFRIIWMEKDGSDPWDEITGKIEIGSKVNVEELVKEKGFEES